MNTMKVWSTNPQTHRMFDGIMDLEDYWHLKTEGGQLFHAHPQELEWHWETKLSWETWRWAVKKELIFFIIEEPKPKLIEVEVVYRDEQE